jgi:hypothetical protein
MKRLGTSSLAVVLIVSLFAACRRSSETTTAKPSGTDSGAPAASAPDLDGFEVEFPSAAVPARMAPGAAAKVRLEVKNVGSKAWPSGGDHPLVFGYHWEAPGADGNWGVVLWDDSNRGTLPANVPPGETVVVTLPVKALPNACPSCRLVIAPLLEMKAWSEKAKSITPVNIS